MLKRLENQESRSHLWQSCGGIVARSAWQTARRGATVFCDQANPRMGGRVLSLALAMSHTSACGPAPSPPAGATLMKGITYRCYGSPDVLRYEDIPKPTAADDEVLVKVHAASVNPLDWHYMEGTPYIVRMDVGFGKPRIPRLGVDFAGTVEAVGRNVTRFKPGDEVFGGKFGAFAEYVAVREDRAIALK